MALPTAPEARPFYQSALQRLEDADYLLEAGRTTGAVYLAGYGIECMLKALILSLTPPRERGEVVASFRGARAHDFIWLRQQYLRRGGPASPLSIAERLALVNVWSTNLRYKSATSRPSQAAAFLDAARTIMEWADGRL